MQELDHETREALEGPRNSHSGTDFDQNTFGRVNVYLELPSLIDWRVEQGEKTLEWSVRHWSTLATFTGA